ncbi:MAG: EamA family transporter, partial [Candidatus Babeliales bacterium]
MNIKNSIQTFLSILLVSLTFILGKTLEHVSSPSLLSFLRFATSSLCFLPFVNYVSLRAISLKNFILMAIASLFGIVAFNVFFFSAVKYTSAINIALLNALVPLLTVITSIFIKK